MDEETTSGLSKIEYKNGIVFEGNLEKSLRKGRGTLTIKKALNDFIIAYGEWDNMKLKGIIKWDKANEYEKSSGCFSFTEGNNPTMDFYGQISFRNGSNYWGGFKENKLHGFGQLDLKSNDNKIKQYLGEFEEAKKSGFGVLKENDLDPITYKGRFKNNKKSGYGIVYRKDEKSLEGLFEDGIFKSGWMYINDKVIEKIESNFFEYNETKDLYSPKGFGTIFLKDGNRLECSLDNAIEDISEKKFKRIGILITETSSFYEGLIDMFKVQSHGTYRNGLMTLYEGEFKYGLFQGYGKIYDKKGRMYQGYFEKGMKLGFGREVDENEENVFSGYWKNGLRDGYGKIARAIEEKKDEIFVLCQGLKIIKIIKM